MVPDIAALRDALETLADIVTDVLSSIVDAVGPLLDLIMPPSTYPPDEPLRRQDIPWAVTALADIHAPDGEPRPASSDHVSVVSYTTFVVGETFEVYVHPYVFEWSRVTPGGVELALQRLLTRDLAAAPGTVTVDVTVDAKLARSTTAARKEAGDAEYIGTGHERRDRTDHA